MMNWQKMLCGALLLAACEDAERTGGTPEPVDAYMLDAGLMDESVFDMAPPETLSFTVVTFNTGSAPELDHDGPPEDGYGPAEAELTDTWYGNGLAWMERVNEAAAFMADLQPDLVAFQEIFHPGDCAEVPSEHHGGFVCDGWSPDQPTVAQRVLGDGWQVACHPGKPDKCVGVHRRLGMWAGCEGALCLEGLTGEGVDGCGRGARVASGVLQLVDGRALTVVSVHGTSGFEAESIQCRRAQVEQALTLAGEGPVVILGDLNTDPGRAAGVDESAGRWVSAVEGEGGLRFISEVGRDVEPTYAGLFNIDHVLARGLEGACVAAGLPGGPPPVTEAVFFDHVPIICDLNWGQSGELPKNILPD
ncbi:MAG: endonuclease/exonuclease/phosphatase family protein [Bradymonadia bacterium]